MKKKKRKTLMCPYCGHEALFVFGDIIYPHRRDLWKKPFWACEPCGAYVGCHPGTENPLGRLANSELRSAKVSVHAAFDPLWRSGRMSRNAAYRWLAENLGIEVRHCHVGMFDVEMCRKAVFLCESLEKESHGTV